MPIIKDLRSRADEVRAQQGRVAGVTPDEVPDVIGPVMERWFDNWLEARGGDRPMAVEDTWFRASWAGKCTHDLALCLAGVEPSNPPDLATAWRFHLGDIVHDEIQGILVEQFGEDVCEVKLRLDIDGSAHADALVTHDDGTRTLLEIKSIGGFQFKRMVGAFKGPAEGPRDSAIRQGALAAKAAKVDRLVVALFALENVSNDVAGRKDWSPIQKFAAQWTLFPDEFMPIAEEEEAKVQWVMDRLVTKEEGDVAEGLVVERAHQVPRIVTIDDGTPVTIIDPPSGGYEARDDNGNVLQVGTTWHCSYCSNYDNCIGG